MRPGLLTCDRDLVILMHALMPKPFVLFGPSHVAMIACSVIVPLILSIFARLFGNQRLTRAICWSFAVILTGTWAAWYVAAYRNGWLALDDALPMNLCDWAAATTVLALIRPGQRAYELAYFWALGGTLQGIITPDIPYDFPEVRFVIFSIYHGGIIAAVLFLTLAAGWRPRLQSFRRVVCWTIFYGFCAALVDVLLGTNYGFLRAKPAQASLFDFMPAWPYYIPELVVLSFITLGVYYIPFLLIDTKKNRSARRSAAKTLPFS